MDAKSIYEDTSCCSEMNPVTEIETIRTSAIAPLSVSTLSSNTAVSSYSKLRALASRLRHDKELKVVERQSFSSGGDFISLNEQNSKSSEIKSNFAHSSVANDAIYDAVSSVSIESQVQTLVQPRLTLQIRTDASALTSANVWNKDSQSCSSETVANSKQVLNSIYSAKNIIVEKNKLQNKDCTSHVPCCIAVGSMSIVNKPFPNVSSAISQAIFTPVCSVVYYCGKSNMSSSVASVQPKLATVQPKPTIVQSKPTALQPKPTIAQCKSTSVQSKPIVVQYKPAAVQPKSTTVQSKSTTVQSKSTTVQSKSTTVQSKSATVQSKETAVQPKLTTHNTVTTSTQTTMRLSPIAPSALKWDKNSFVAPAVYSSRYSLIKKAPTTMKYASAYSVRPARGYPVQHSRGRRGAAAFYSPVFTSRHALSRIRRSNVAFNEKQYSYNKQPVRSANKPYSWSANHATKKIDVPDTNLQLGRKVKNLSKNRYRFINASAVNLYSSAITSKCRRQSLTRKSRFRIDKRQLSPSVRFPWRSVVRTPQRRRLSSCSTRQSAQQVSSKYKFRRRSGSSLTVTPRTKKLASKTTEKQYCKFYIRFGRCNRGDKCLYVHDPDRVSICTRFLRGTCNIEDCPFSHNVRRDRMPTCRHFLRGVCLRGSDCPYLHVNVGAEAAVCEKFLQGNCPDGEMCKKRHELICPDYLKSGACPLGDKCLMKHWRRANKNPTNRGAKTSSMASNRNATSDKKETTYESGASSSAMRSVSIERASEGKSRRRKTRYSKETEDISESWNAHRMPSYISILSSPDMDTLQLNDQEASAAETSTRAIQHSQANLSRQPIKRDIHPRLCSTVDNQVHRLLNSYLDTIIPPTDDSFDQAF